MAKSNCICPGLYYLRFQHLQQTTTRDTVSTFPGEEVESFTLVGEHWGYLENLTAFELLAFGALQSESKIKVILRNNLPVTALDRLQLKSSGEVFWVDGVQYDLLETICFCHSIGGKNL